MSRQCKGCRTGESLRRQGAAQRGGPHRWGHSPIAGDTLANGAIEEASSPWADTGLAQGARPLSQRAGSASSAAAYKDAPDANSVFFSPAIHRVILSLVSLLGKGDYDSTVWLLLRKRLPAKGKHVCICVQPANTDMSRPRAFGARTYSSHAALLSRPQLARNGWLRDGPALPLRTKMTTTT